MRICREWKWERVCVFACHDEDGDGMGLDLRVALEGHVVAGVTQEREHLLRRRRDLEDPDNGRERERKKMQVQILQKCDAMQLCSWRLTITT